LVRDGNIGGILARTVSGANRYYHYDGSGNVVQVTKGDKTTMAEYSYDAYGVVTSSSGTEANSNPYRYQAKEVHTRTGFVDFGYRFYSPGLGRWINRDPIEEDGGLNLYAAFANDPVNKWDEYGEALPAAAAAVAAARAAAPYVARMAPVVVAGAKKLLSRSSKKAGKSNSKQPCPQDKWMQKRNRGAINPKGNSGQRHAGFRRNYENKSRSEISKGIRSLKKEIAEHQDKIANPEKYIPHFRKLDPRRQNHLIHKKWPADIKRQREQLKILEDILKKIGGT
jgi:RHS repeat-associated protein